MSKTYKKIIKGKVFLNKDEAIKLCYNLGFKGLIYTTYGDATQKTFFDYLEIRPKNNNENFLIPIFKNDIIDLTQLVECLIKLNSTNND